MRPDSCRVFSENQLVEDDAEFGQVVAAVTQLLFQGVAVDVGVVGAQQALGVGDQAVQMAFRIGGGVGRSGRMSAAARL
jgi:hypothetical protein